MKRTKNRLDPPKKEDMGSGSFLFVFLRNLRTQDINLGPQDIQNAQNDDYDQAESQKRKGILPGIQFTESPHQEQITDKATQAGTRNYHDNLFMSTVEMYHMILLFLFLVRPENNESRLNN
jgi:hypothetical protein